MLGADRGRWWLQRPAIPVPCRRRAEPPVAPKQDTAAKMSDQWVRFRDAFMQPETALIFHLKNHYALIYALREWISSDGTHVRQLLTARYDAGTGLSPRNG